MEKANNDTLFRRNFIWNMIGSTLYSITSLIFMIIVTRVNGVEQAGIFTFGFSFACMMFIIGIFSGRTYQVTERNPKLTESCYLYFKIVCCCVMIAISIIFCIIKQYDIYKTTIVLILVFYKALDAFADGIYGVFQKHNKLYQSGISLTIKSTFCVLGFLAIDLLTKNLLVSTIFILIIDIVIFIIYDISKLKWYKIVNKKLTIKLFKMLFLGGLSVFLFFFLSQYVTNAQKYVIDDFLSNEAQAIFGIILMPATFMSVCSQFIINPFITALNNKIEENDKKSFVFLVTKICLVILAVAAVVLFAAWILGIPVLKILYGVELDNYLPHLMIILIGSTFFGLISVLSNSLIALRKNWIQVGSYLLASLFAFIVSPILISELDLYGASLGYMLTTLLLFTLYVIAFIIILLKNKDLITHE